MQEFLKQEDSIFTFCRSYMHLRSALLNLFITCPGVQSVNIGSNTLIVCNMTDHSRAIIHSMPCVVICVFFPHSDLQIQHTDDSGLSLLDSIVQRQRAK